MPTNNATTHPFAAMVLQWYAAHRRDLPWRNTRDPYAIWLSEVILQQTRIEQGRPYWERFMERYPTVQDLAAASEDDVLRLWQGLGYYSRARNLHAAAQQVAQMGAFPTTLDGIKALKGVGDYTAAAIASMAFDIPAAVVDGNVYRVLARHFGISTPINTTEGKREFAALAQELLPPAHAAAFNQAMMDFGATWCTPRSPRCTDCPLADSCLALHDGTVETLPVKLKKLLVSTRHFQYIYISCMDYTALRRRPAGDIWQGLWEPWLIEGDHDALLQAMKTIPGTLTLLRSGVKHVLTHRIIMADFYRLDCDTRPSLPDGYRWIPEDDIDHYAIPRLVERLLDFKNK
ncbi:MAG: A/G-specific adenine glycosylase [Muribaculaceae bacterium]|nr:A/G-specific adenine glycosylase [Muribaculaceae bacterium]